MGTGRKIYCHYAGADAEHFTKFEKHAAGLIAQGFEFPHSGETLPGSSTEEAALAAVDSAEVSVMFISSDFLSDDLCQKVWARALQRDRQGSTQVVLVYVRAAHLPGTGLDDFRLLPDDRPVTGWTDRDDAWRSVVNSLSAIVGGAKGAEYESRKELNRLIVDSKKRCLDLTEDLKACGQPVPFSKGYWWSALTFIPTREVSLRDFQSRFGDITSISREEGGLAPAHDVHRYENSLECLANLNPGDFEAYYWQVSPTGTFFQAGEHRDDLTWPDNLFLDLVFPIRNIALSLKFAQRLLIFLDEESAHYFHMQTNELPPWKMKVKFGWTGLKSRILTDRRNDFSRHHAEKRGKCWQAEIQSHDKSISMQEIRVNLPSLIQELTEPLYSLFNNTPVHLSRIEAEIKRSYE